jgi:hypothetical protein
MNVPNAQCAKDVLESSCLIRPLRPTLTDGFDRFHERQGRGGATPDRSLRALFESNLVPMTPAGLTVCLFGEREGTPHDLSRIGSPPVFA